MQCYENIACCKKISSGSYLKYTCLFPPKNVSTLSCYSLDVHEPILTIFENVSHHLPISSRASELRGETEKLEISSFHLNDAVLPTYT